MGVVRIAVCLVAIVASGIVNSLQAEQDLIVNGTFTSDTGWNELGRYNDGDATGLVEANAYLVKMVKPGTELWSVQLTQSHIKLQNGAAYILTFEASASVERTIEVTISRNGGDYVSYSGKDTIKLTPTRKLVTHQFIMKLPTDNDARLEFNCGKNDGTIALRNVHLYQFTEKVLDIETPYAERQLVTGMPYAVRWSAVNMQGNLRLDFSPDNGTSWVAIDTVSADSSPYLWTPRVSPSAWCKIRLSTIDTPFVAAVSKGTFELVPSRELLGNGSFFSLDTGWSLGKNNAKADSKINAYGGYEITIQESGSENWNVQLTQSKVVLNNGARYRYSFLAFSEKPVVVDVNIGTSHDPYTSYLDSASRLVTLSTTPTRYSFVFTMNAPTDSNARFEVNCGKASGILFFDDFSLMQEYVAPVVYSPLNLNKIATVSRTLRTSNVYLAGGALQRRSLPLLDLLGRSRATGMKLQNNGSRGRSVASGCYVVPLPNARKSHEK